MGVSGARLGSAGACPANFTDADTISQRNGGRLGTGFALGFSGGDADTQGGAGPGGGVQSFSGRGHSGKRARARPPSPKSALWMWRYSA